MNNLFRWRIKPALEDDFAAVSRQVFQHWRTLESGEPASCVWLASRIEQLHRELSTTPDFYSKVRQSEDLAATGKPYHWIPLVEQESFRSGLLYLPPGGGIAMHDHPGCIGVSIVLEGTPLISQSDRVSTNGRIFTSLATEKISYRRLQPQQKSFIFPHKNNLHGFSATDSSCLLLNALFHKHAMPHQGFIPAEVIDRSVSGLRLSCLQKSLAGLFLSISLSLPAAVYADALALHADTVAMSAMLFDDLETVALNGNVHAQTWLAARYASGNGVDRDLYRASIWYRRAAEGGCAEAQYQIGVMLLDGVGMTEDSAEGLEWIFRASQADHVKATAVFNYLMANPVALDC